MLVHESSWIVIYWSDSGGVLIEGEELHKTAPSRAEGMSSVSSRASYLKAQCLKACSVNARSGTGGRDLATLQTLYNPPHKNNAAFGPFGHYDEHPNMNNQIAGKHKVFSDVASNEFDILLFRLKHQEHCSCLDLPHLP